MVRRVVSRSLLLSVFAVSCAAPVYPVTPRQPGDRTPITAHCSPFDSERCIVPWPANNFTIADATTATGLRLSFDVSHINPNDHGDQRLSVADGFSRVTSLVVQLPGTLDPASFGGPRGGAIRLFVATASSPHYGEEVPLAVQTYLDGVHAVNPRSALVADPLAMLEPQTDYVAVVTDALHASAGPQPIADPMTEVALGILPPASPDQARLAGYYVPIVSLLQHEHIDPMHVVRAWEFTTRSVANAQSPLDSMITAAVAAVDSGAVTIAWDTVVNQPAGGPIATIVTGRLVGVPNWIDSTNAFTTDANGIPMTMGTTDAPFRVVIPSGTGSYRAVLYGHGAAGNYMDTNFDATLAQHGVAKVAMQFYGWTDQTLVDTLGHLPTVLDGAHRAFAPLMQAVAHACAIRRGLDTILADALAAPMINGMPNANAGRHVDWSHPTWVGGSLGGTMGLTVASVSDEIHTAVLNVPGAAWSRFVFHSAILQTFLSGISMRNGNSTANVVSLIAVCQTIFDGVDGATFAERGLAGGDVYLEQESMGDMVLPNPGNEMVAIVTHATQVGVVLRPIEGLSSANMVTGMSGMTQYHVGDTGTFDVHGFAARDTPAGHAAFAQITSFLDSAWAGTPVITVPAGCDPTMGCVFPASP
jgi:hypothetical protein